LEKDETPEDGILREVQEEINLNGEIVDFIGMYSFFEMNQLILAYYIKAEGKIILNDELAEVKLIQKEKLKAWDFGTGLAVHDWIQKYQNKEK
jgi:NAD+ diphosphatase